MVQAGPLGPRMSHLMRKDLTRARLIKPRAQDQDSSTGLRWHQSRLTKGGSWPHLQLILASGNAPVWLDFLLFQEGEEEMEFLVVNSN